MQNHEGNFPRDAIKHSLSSLERLELRAAGTNYQKCSPAKLLMVPSLPVPSASAIVGVFDRPVLPNALTLSFHYGVTWP